MRILMVGTAPAAGAELGRAAAFERLAALLTEEHAVFRVWATRSGPPPQAPEGTLLVEGAREGLWFAWGVRQAVTRFRPDLLVCAGAVPPPTRRPAIAVIRDLARTGWETGPARRVALRRFLRVVVPTPEVRRQVPGDPFRIEVIQDPVLRFGPLPDPGPGLVLAQVGPIHPSRRPHVSIEAVATLSPDEKRRVRLVVAGEVRDPRYLAQLRVQAAGQPVELRPDPPSLRPTLTEAHLALYPTAVDDGWPDAPLLAAASARPVLVSDRRPLCALLGANARPVGEGTAAWREAIRRGPFPVAPWQGDDVGWRWRQLLRSV